MALEYTTISSIDSEGLAVQMSALGKEGWEAIHIESHEARKAITVTSEHGADGESETQLAEHLIVWTAFLKRVVD
jgi:hypothetical protein